MAGKKGQKKFLPPTKFLLEAERRRMEKEDTCPHGDVTFVEYDIWECVCGKSFNQDEIDEMEWDLEEEATKTNAQ